MPKRERLSFQAQEDTAAESPLERRVLSRFGKDSESSSEEDVDFGKKRRRLGKASPFDPVTGAVSRGVSIFGGRSSDQHNPKGNGYGRTAELSRHPWLCPQIMLFVGPTGKGKTQCWENVLDEVVRCTNPRKLGKIYVYSGSEADPALKVFKKEEVNLYGPDEVNSLISDLKQHMLDCRSIVRGDTNPNDEAGGAEKRLFGRATDGETTTTSAKITGVIRRELGKGGTTTGIRKDDEQSAKKRSEKDLPLSILVIDDAGTSHELSPDHKGSFMSRVYVGHRHLGLVVMFAAQAYHMISHVLRKNCSRLFLFPTRSDEEMAVLRRDIPLPKQEFEQEVNLVAGKPHQFLVVNKPENTMTQGFGTVVLK